MKLQIEGVCQFSGANCNLVRGIKKEKEATFTETFIQGLIGRTINHFDGNVRWDIKVTKATLINN